MYRILFLLLLFVPVVTLAHKPFLPEFPTYDDYYLIEDPEVSQAFYGELEGFPHTYEVNINEKQKLNVEVLVPDINTAEPNRSAIIVRQLRPGSVEEVARLHYRDASWESFYEPFGGDSYLKGATYNGELTPGKYLIEVSTGDNLGKYVLVVGELEDFSDMGYFEVLSRIYEVKRFFDKSPLAVMQSPFYYIPTLLLITIGYFLYRKYKVKHA